MDDEQLLERFSRHNLPNISQEELIALDSNIRGKILEKLTKEIHFSAGEVDISEIWMLTDKFAVQILLHCLANLDETSTGFSPFGRNSTTVYSSLRSLWFTIRFGSEENKYDYYLKISDIIETFIQVNILPSVLHQSASDSFFMTKFILAFKKIKHLCNWIHELFFKIEEYVMKDFYCPSFTSLSMFYFSEKLVKPCEQRLALSVHSEISRERSGGVVNAEEISDCINILQLMGSTKDVKVFKSNGCKNFTRNESSDAYIAYYRVEIQNRRTLIPNNQLTNTKLISEFPASYCGKFSDFNKLPHDLSFYVAGFETKFLIVSKEYFSTISARIESTSVEDYILQVQKIEKDEISRATKYLHLSTRPKLLITCMEQLYLVNKEKIMLNASHALKEFFRSDTTNLPDDSKCDHLKRLFHIIIQCTICNPEDSTFDLLTEFAELFSSEIKIKLEEFFVQKIESAPTLKEIQERKDNKIAPYPKFNSDVKFVQDIIFIYQRALFLVETFFDGNALCGKKSFDSFVVYVNKYFSCPEKKIECNFLDFIIDYGDKILQDKLTKEVLDSEKALCTYCYEFFHMIIQKDVFIDAWGYALANRIIQGNIKNNDLEDKFIQTAIFHTDKVMWKNCVSMLNHVHESPQLNEEFQMSLTANNQSLPINSFSSLNQMLADWKRHISTDNSSIEHVIPTDLLPPVLRECKVKFEEWYLEKFNGKKIDWIYEYGDVEMEIRTDKKYKFVFPSTIQAVIAMVFSETSSPIHLDDIKKKTSINNSDYLKKVLGSLTKQLRNNSESCFLIKVKDIKDTYSFNTNFKSKYTENKFVRVPKEENKDKDVLSNNQIQEDRKIKIECAIVRIMKSRKTLDHKNLMMEVISQVNMNFKPDPMQIKQRIESLIERDFLEKTGAQGNFGYKYLA